MSRGAGLRGTFVAALLPKDQRERLAGAGQDVLRAVPRLHPETGVQRVGVESRHVGCTSLPTTALTQCTSEGEKR